MIAERLPLPKLAPLWSEDEVAAAQEGALALSDDEYRALRGAPPPGVCDCCSCNATRNHKQCYELDEPCTCDAQPEVLMCDPRVMCQHCGTCWCSLPEDDGDG